MVYFPSSGRGGVVSLMDLNNSLTLNTCVLCFSRGIVLNELGNAFSLKYIDFECYLISYPAQNVTMHFKLFSFVLTGVQNWRYALV